MRSEGGEYWQAVNFRLFILRGLACFRKQNLRSKSNHYNAVIPLDDDKRSEGKVERV